VQEPRQQRAIGRLRERCQGRDVSRFGRAYFRTS
jgi:hypothetical protein